MSDVTGEETLCDFDKLDAIAHSPYVASASDRIEVNDPRDGGRPAQHSKFELTLMHTITKYVYGGRVRKAVRELRHPKNWQHLSDCVKVAYPDNPERWLGSVAPKRHHYLHFRKRYLAAGSGLNVLADELTLSGLELAAVFGLCQGEGRSVAKPRAENCVRADGKVVSSATRYRPRTPVADPTTGEILRYRRSDPDVGEYTEGGSDSPVRGHRFVTMSARGAGPYRRAILGIEQAPAGEMDAAQALLERLTKDLKPDALIYDGAPHGTHIHEIFRRFGVAVLSPVSPKKAETEETPRIDHEVKVEVADATAPDGSTRQVEVWAYRGAFCEVAYNENGDRVLLPLEPTSLERRGVRKFRLYGSYKTGAGETVRLSLLPTVADMKRKFNRCQYVRPYPMDGAVYGRLYRTRPDAEALHRQMEDALWQKRANCYGRNRVYADLLGWALGENAVVAWMAKHRASKAPPGNTIAA